MSPEESEIVQSFLNGAARDLEIGRVLLENRKFPGAVSSACSALENALKAIFVKATREDPPSTRSLSYLARSAAVELPESIMDRLVEYTRFCSEEPYGGDWGGRFTKRNEELSHQKFSEMENLHHWLVRELRNIF
jgi:HEPN domain-containing protein